MDLSDRKDMINVIASFFRKEQILNIFTEENTFLGREKNEIFY